MIPLNTLNVGFAASGAAAAGAAGHVVVIVDIIHMSTTAEACLSAGALTVFGATPASVTPPIPVDPVAVGRAAALSVPDGRVAIFSEPRTPADLEKRTADASLVMEGVRSAGGSVVGEVGPNLGIDSPAWVDVEGCAVVVVSHAGGVSFDAAMTAGATRVITATIARGWGRKGWDSAQHGVERAIAAVVESGAPGLSFIAASANSPEDVHAVFDLAQRALEAGFLNLPGTASASLSRGNE